MNLEKKVLELTDSEVMMESLGSFVHGTLFSLHALGVAYNLKKRNWVDAGIHASVAAYDAMATYRHAKRVTDSNKKYDGL